MPELIPAAPRPRRPNRARSPHYWRGMRDGLAAAYGNTDAYNPPNPAYPRMYRLGYDTAFLAADRRTGHDYDYTPRAT